MDDEIINSEPGNDNRKINVLITWNNVGKLGFHKNNGPDYVFAKDRALARMLRIPFEPDTVPDWIPPDDADAETNGESMKAQMKKSLSTYKDGTIAQFMRLYGYDSVHSNYRRYKLSAFLNKKYGDEYQGIIDVRKMSVGHYKYMIISNSVGWYTIKDNFDYDYLIYDRTDNWGSWSKENQKEEDELISSADIVFNSSRWLYNDSKKKRTGPTYFIPNGCDVKEYIPQEKYEKITGCYAGKTDNKIDWNLVKQIADKYPLKIFGLIDPQFDHENVEWCGFLPEDELQHAMAKCHFGLIPFKPGEWTAAMLPLKLFHYANSHIPTVYKNCPEADAYPEIAYPMTMDYFEILEPSEEDYDKVLKEADWQHKFEEMINIIEEFAKEHDNA